MFGSSETFILKVIRLLKSEIKWPHSSTMEHVLCRYID